MFRYPKETQSGATSPPHQEEPIKVVLASGKDASLVRWFTHVQLGRDPEENRGHAGKSMPLEWPRNALESSQRSWMRWPSSSSGSVPSLGEALG